MNYKTKKKKWVQVLFPLLVGILISTATYSQTRLSVKGHIVDDLGEPVIGASVVIKGTTNGTVSDPDGNFEIQTPSDATLVVSFIGFKPKEVAVDGKSFLRISLDENTEILKDVIVIGYGSVKKMMLQVPFRLLK